MVAELAVCVVGIYTCFLTWQLTQEAVTTQLYGGQKFRHFVFLNVVQSLCASLVGFIYVRLIKKQPLGRPSKELWTGYIQCAFLTTVAPQFGYEALKHIDYPTVILGKSCKLVPVLLMNFLIYRRTFPAQKYLIVALITAGVSAFMLLHKQEDDAAAKRGGRSNSLYGLGLLLVNLLMDGAVNSTQDRIFHKFKVTGASMMVYLNLLSSAAMTLYLLLNPFTAELSSALTFCHAHPRIVADILLYGFCGAIGQCFIYHTLERFGAVSLVTVTVTRKMFSILLSFFWFDHHVSLGQWAAVGLVFTGIGLEAVMKRAPSKEKATPMVNGIDEKAKAVKTGVRQRKRAD
ncbi:UAA transporter [Fimicolochytrium jonesii]|uniref:UAA transporter n=1 Tax=Fimicolochytrium jonesii TaxID=1396493 RepID=UPI0022FF27E2|nr:UAA transporter [Fimicolochytrium jonesii]KAI8822686.1 UAA transporter [Fimicolochytrium jonesii]